MASYLEFWRNERKKRTKKVNELRIEKLGEEKEEDAF